MVSFSLRWVCNVYLFETLTLAHSWGKATGWVLLAFNSQTNKMIIRVSYYETWSTHYKLISDELTKVFNLYLLYTHARTHTRTFNWDILNDSDTRTASIKRHFTHKASKLVSINGDNVDRLVFHISFCGIVRTNIFHRSVCHLFSNAALQKFRSYSFLFLLSFFFRNFPFLMLHCVWILILRACELQSVFQTIDVADIRQEYAYQVSLNMLNDLLRRCLKVFNGVFILSVHLFLFH